MCGRCCEVFQTLIDSGATVIVIEHDLDVIRNADYMIDMGPGGGEEGGRIVAAGTPEAVRENPESVTGRPVAGGWAWGQVQALYNDTDAAAKRPPEAVPGGAFLRTEMGTDVCWRSTRTGNLIFL